jgi:hypothetical protein
VIESRDEPARQAGILLHEAAHMILHTHDEPGEYVAHRGLQETEAESVAYVVAQAAGLPYHEAIHYIAGWSRSELEILEQAAENVRRAATLLIEALGIQ